MTEIIDGEIKTEIEDGWTNVKVDSQVFSAWMSCPRYMDYRYNRHLVPIAGPSHYILKGTLAHEGTHKFNVARIKGADWASAKAIGLQAARVKAPTLNISADDALDVYRLLEQFWEFKQSNAIYEIPLAAERTFTVLVYEDELLRLRIYLTGRIDYIFKLISGDGGIIPLDYKTESEKWFYSSMSNQFKFYAIATKSNSVVIQRLGFQTSKKPEEKFKTETISFDPEVMDEMINVIIPETCKNMLIAIEEKKFLPNTTNCIHGHFACMFSDKYNNGGICSISPKIREEKIARYFSVGQEWSPENG